MYLISGFLCQILFKIQIHNVLIADYTGMQKGNLGVLLMFSLAEGTISNTTDETGIRLGVKQTSNTSLDIPATVLVVSNIY